MTQPTRSFAGSRYRGLTAYPAPAPDGTSRPTLPLRPPPPPAPAQTPYLHTLVAGETLESLAARYLGSSELWWQIADVNPVAFPADIAPGSVVAIPTGAAPGLVVRTRSF
jgi:nucleoid-associated protein YgaU